MRVGVVSMGPVSKSQVAPATKGMDVPIMAIDCSTIVPQPPACITADAEGAKLRPSHFPAWIATLGSDPIGTLCKRLNVDAVYLAAFSAGAGGLDGLLKLQAGDKRILGCVSADAYYGLGVKQGYMAQAKAAQTSGVPFVLTSSASKDNKFAVHSGEESIQPFLEALGMQPVEPPASVPPPEAAKAKGPVLWLDYPKFTHIEHATKVLPVVLRSMIRGELGLPGPTPPAPPEPAPERDMSATKAIALIAGVAVGYAVVRIATAGRLPKRRRR